jgi:uncharacterized protein (TIGR01777 family)
MRVVVTGATGSIGRRLVPALVARGDIVTAVSRRPRDARRIFGSDVEIVAGDCTCPGPWQRTINGADAVVHLAGAGIADARWSRRVRDRIESSRVESTHQVVAAIEDAETRPLVFVCASGTGWYGDAGDEEATERFPVGKGFLADVCLRWEEEARKAEAFGVRTVRARIGIVLDEEGPALRRMLPWFRAGLGPVLGSGTQWMPWIHHRDCVQALLALVDRPTLAGPVNVVAPEPCTNRAFATALAKAVGRGLLLPVPWWLVRIAVGGIADELVRSQRAVPTALASAGFTFAAPSIERAFELLLAEDDGRAAASARATHTARASGGPTAELPKPSRPPVRPRLVVVGAEGVIDDGHGRMQPGAASAIRAASSHGCAVVLATDRTSVAARDLLRDPLLHPIAIVSNGAVLWNAREASAAYVERIEQTTLAAVVLAARKVAERSVLVFEGDDWLASDTDIPPSVGLLTLRLERGALPPKPTARLHILDVPEAVAAVRTALEFPLWRERRIALFQRGGSRIIVTAPTVDRAVAAQRIARKLGASRDEIMAIVSVDDDLGLADWCGFSVALADAPDAVRRLAGAVAPAEPDAFAAIVEQFIGPRPPAHTSRT